MTDWPLIRLVSFSANRSLYDSFDMSPIVSSKYPRRRKASPSSTSMGYHSANRPLDARGNVPLTGDFSNPSLIRVTTLSNSGTSLLLVWVGRRSLNGLLNPKLAFGILYLRESTTNKQFKWDTCTSFTIKILNIEWRRQTSVNQGFMVRERVYRGCSPRYKPVKLLGRDGGCIECFNFNTTHRLLYILYLSSSCIWTSLSDVCVSFSLAEELWDLACPLPLLLSFNDKKGSPSLW